MNQPPKTAAEPGRHLAGRAAVVTGSTSGIGLGIAHALAAAGADILLNGFGGAAEIERVKGDLAERHRVRVDHDGSDLTKPEAVAEMIENAGKRFGTVDILVNNAGIQHVAPIEEFPPQKWDQI